MVTEVVAPPEEEGVDPNVLYQDRRPEANLQQVINEHINDPVMPRYTVVLENHPGGKIKLPKNVRLYLRNCGQVILEDSEGNNALSYSGGDSLIIIKCKDVDVTVLKPEKLCDFLSMVDCRIKMQGVKTKHTNCSRSTIEAVDHAGGKSMQTDTNASYDKASFEKLTLERSNVDAQQLSCQFDLIAKDKSTVNAVKVDTQRLTAESSTLFFRDIAITDTASVKESNLTILDSTRGIQEMEVDKSGYVLNTVKILADCKLTESSGSAEILQVEGNLEATKGQLTSQSIEVKGTTNYVELNHIGVSDKHEGKVTYDKSVTNLDGSEYKSDLQATDTTAKQRGLAIEGNLECVRGTTDMKGVTGQGNASLVDQVGRNFVRKVVFNSDLTVSGNSAAHLELSDSNANSLSVGGFAYSKVNSLGGSEVALSGFGYLELNQVQGNLTIGATKMASLLGVVGNVEVSGGIVNAAEVQGNLTLNGCTFDVANVAGAIVANDSVGIAKNASSFTGNNTSASVKDVGGWAGGAFLFSGMGPLGPTIKGTPTLRIESPGTLHIFSETQVIVEGPTRTEVF